MNTSVKRALSSIALAGALALSSSAMADDGKGFRMDLGLGGSWSHGIDAYGGSLSLEPKWRINPKFVIGARGEVGGRAGASADEMSTVVSASTAASAAFLAKGEYRILDGDVKPFVGLGTGVVYLSGGSATGSALGGTVEAGTGTHFAVAPQVGIDMGRFRLAATYNALFGDTETIMVESAGQVQEAETDSQNYLVFELAFRFGRD